MLYEIELCQLLKLRQSCDLFFGNSNNPRPSATSRASLALVKNRHAAQCNRTAMLSQAVIVIPSYWVGTGALRRPRRVQRRKRRTCEGCLTFVRVPPAVAGAGTSQRDVPTGRKASVANNSNMHVFCLCSQKHT